VIGKRWIAPVIVALLLGAAGLWSLGAIDEARSNPVQGSSAGPAQGSSAGLTRAGSLPSETETATGRSDTNVDVSCPPTSPHASQGGATPSSEQASLLPSAPRSGNDLASDGEQPTGWRVRYESGQRQPSSVRAYVVCAP